MSKKNKIIETEEVLEEPIVEVVEEPVEEEIIEEAPIVEEPFTNKIVLKIEISFSDKNTNVKYKVGDKIPFEIERADELLNDPRHLVSKV